MTEACNSTAEGHQILQNHDLPSSRHPHATSNQVIRADRPRFDLIEVRVYGEAKLHAARALGNRLHHVPLQLKQGLVCSHLRRIVTLLLLTPTYRLPPPTILFVEDHVCPLTGRLVEVAERRESVC